jgi:serine protease AprX
MRHLRADSSGKRSNALWGRGSRGEQRSNALWGRGGRRAGVASAAMVVLFAMASVAAAGVRDNGGGTGQYDNLKSYVPSALLSAIQQNPTQSFDVILLGDRKQGAHGFIQKILADQSGSSDETVQSGNVKQTYTSIDGAELTLTGKQILRVAKNGIAESIVSNDTVKAQSYSNPQGWTSAVDVWPNWSSPAANAPTIAVVDSGIQANRPDFGFGSRVLAQVNLTSLLPNSAGDGFGHGTFVAGIAAGSANGYAGAMPNANLLSIDVMNDQGQGTVSDVIRACDWILANKAKYNIQVANFSLHAASGASVLFDPLDQAVEKLWLNGVVVVAAAGNYGTDPVASGVPFAPGNDPFVITVGATDIGNGNGGGDDSVAPWSAYGYTPDGFWKPDLGAPGRYLVGPVPATSTLPLTRPDKVTGLGYMQLSGTSFAAPFVSAAAATLRALHPTWTPDQVKGALMVSASKEPMSNRQVGVGDVSIASARNVTAPPNPNAPLDRYLTTAADGTTVFNAMAWRSAALSNSTWDAAAWSDAAWSSAAWASVAWSDAAWADAAWATAAWSTVAWSDAAWADAAWSDAAWADSSVQ